MKSGGRSGSVPAAVLLALAASGLGVMLRRGTRLSPLESAALAAFKARYEKALSDPQLRGNLLRYQHSWKHQRDAAFSAYEERGGESFQAMRHQMAEAKDRALADLPGYFRQFKDAAERAGAVVYEAGSPEDANRYILDLATRKGASLALKVKSMVSEEIRLNSALEEGGLKVVETDFGEYIVQLAREHPSHMISPIAHKNRYQVAELLNRESGGHLTGDDIGELAAVARSLLREQFLSGEVGISGANALVAETGSVLLVTNEGNAELTTTLPPVHVVVTGYEKLVPTMADAMLQLRVLSRSGTGQQITSYTTFITGPDRPERELHIVMVDNGRSIMRSDPNFVDALRCIRCGACANVCPPYQVVSGHVFGYIYAGAIGLVVTPFHHGLRNGAGPQSLCVSCNACATVCPVEIPLPRQILDVRKEAVEWLGLPWYKRAAMEVWARPALFDAAMRAGAVLQKPVARDGFLRIPLPAPHSWRTPPALADRPARDLLPHRPRTTGAAGPISNSAARGLKVAYFIQCITDRFLPEAASATVRVLEACGAEVAIPEKQHCCGLPAFDSGDWKNALAMAKDNLRLLERLDADYIVTGAASCVAMMVHDYPHLFAQDPEWLERVRRVAPRVVDFTGFLDRIARLPAGALASDEGYSVTYHNFCQSHNVLGIIEEPRRLITEVLGLRLVEMDEAAVCCGFGGSVSVDHPRVARHIAERKMASIDRTGVTTVVTDNPGCILHLRGAADGSGRALRVLHVAELVDERLQRLMQRS